MNYIKFNCYDLAAQNTELYNIYNKIQMFSEELADVLRTLDPQIKNYTNLLNQFTAVQNAIADSSAHILKTYNVLDQIIDRYYAAESKVKQTVEDLPVDAIRVAANPINISTGRIQTASISRGDLVLEDWLAELLYKDEKDEIDGQ